MFFTLSLSAQTNNMELDSKSDTGLGMGIALVRFDTSLKLTEKKSGRTVFIDADGTLGLPETDILPIIYGQYRFSQKHAIGFNYFKVKRESHLFDLNKKFGDVHIKGNSVIRDETYFFNIKYVNTVHENNHSRVQILYGLNALDIKYGLEAIGEITFNGDLPISGEFKEEANVFVPLPLIGLDLMTEFTPQWKLNAQISLVAGSYQDVKAWVVNTNINVVYQINEQVGVILGLAYFDADVHVSDDIGITEIKYGYDGVIFGLHLVF
jgi:hypothetical protein